MAELATLTRKNLREVDEMADRARNRTDFEKTLKLYLRQAREKLNGDLAGTREAIKLIAEDKTRNFIEMTDRGLSKEEREFLKALIVASMRQSFCYGYGIGKFEGNTSQRVYL